MIYKIAFEQLKIIIMKKILLIKLLLFMLSFNSLSQFSPKAITNFLVKAKAKGYASGDESIIKDCGKGCKVITIKDGDYEYTDRYFGEYSFTGHEIVKHKGTPVWNMNFYGYAYKLENFPNGFPKFHKEALRNMPEEFPFRGPKIYQKGDFVYTNEINGNLKDFYGIEKVFYKGIEIFKLYYHGGELVY